MIETKNNVLFYGDHKRFMIIEDVDTNGFTSYYVHDAHWVKDKDVADGKGSPVVAVFHFLPTAKEWCDAVERNEAESYPVPVGELPKKWRK